MRTAIVVPCVLLAAASSHGAQDFEPAFKIAAQALIRDLGRSQTLEGDTLVVGSPTEADGRGSAVLYTRSGPAWRLDRLLVHAGALAGDGLGRRVAISGERVLAARRFAHEDSGAVHVFARSGASWSEEATWVGGPGFGLVLALSGDLACVGMASSSIDGLPTSEEGVVHVYEHGTAGWTPSLLLPPLPEDHGHFGFAVALQGTTLAVTEARTLPGGGTHGFVHVFERVGAAWVARARLESGRDDDGFGEGLALDGDTLLVGAWLDDAAGLADEGRVFVYRATAGVWSAEATLRAPAPEADSGFGRYLALEGDTALVGAELYDGSVGTSSGAVFAFERGASGWSAVDELRSFEARPYQQFGVELALDGGTALAGAPRGDVGGSPSGSVYLFERGPGSGTIGLDAVVPDHTESLVPGTGRTITLQGHGLDRTRALFIDGVETEPWRYDIPSSTELRLDLPQLTGVGPFSLCVVDDLDSALKVVDVRTPAGSVLEIGQGDELSTTISQARGDVVFARVAGPVGSIQYVYASLSPVPSSNRFVSLALGNQFRELVRFRRLSIPAEGWVDVGYYAPLELGTAPATIYAQSLRMAAPLPFRTSNLVVLQLVP